jgi:hypothetical protein
LLFAPILIFCQSAELNGGITDPQGKSVARAVIHLTRGSAEIARTKSNSDGRFTFDPVDPGDYTLRAEAHGFADISRDERLHSESLNKSFNGQTPPAAQAVADAMPGRLN